MKNGIKTKNPIIGGSNGLLPLKNEKKKVIRKKIKNLYVEIMGEAGTIKHNGN